jgi:membrane fusion protein
VIEGRRASLWGDVILAQPIALPLLTLLAVSICVVLGSFLVWGDYARKETVNGYLAPEQGLIELYAPRPGVFSEIFVEEGQVVEAGDVLMTVSVAQVMQDGAEIDAVLLREIDLQEKELVQSTERERVRNASEAERLRAKIAGLGAETAQLQVLRETQREILALALRHDRVLETLSSEELIPRLRFWEQREVSLREKQRLGELTHEIIARGNALAEARILLDQLPARHADRVSAARIGLSELTQRRLEIAGRLSYAIKAPAAGRVAGLHAHRGKAATPTTPVMSILPESGRLQAELFVPTRAIAFVEAGQTVRLLYHAFPYQRFGAHEGQIVRVTTAPLSPAELHLPLALEESVYRATVRLSKQEIPAFGKTYPLLSGMLLKADIILDRRALLDWLLEPVYSVSRRAYSSS